MTTRCGKQCSSHQNRICNVSELKERLTELLLGLCSRLSLLKLCMNGTNVCELVFVLHKYILSTCFNFNLFSCIYLIVYKDIHSVKFSFQSVTVRVKCCK